MTTRPPLPDEAARERIRRDLDTTLVVEAAAGTGKTSMLVARILALVTAGKAELSGIVAVTFTEKAAGEMKLRLRAEIESARAREATSGVERSRLDRALAQLEEAHISTIHGFCADLLRERPIEARVDPAFEMAADDERERIFDEAFDAWFQTQLERPSPGVARVLRRRSRDRDAAGPRQALRRAGLDLVDQRDFGAPWTPVEIDRRVEIDGVIEALRDLATYAGRCKWPEDWLQKNLAEVARFVGELDRREKIRPRDHDGLEAELRELAKHKKGWTWKGGGKVYGDGLARADVLARRDAVKARLDGVLEAVDADLAACLREELRPLVDAYDALKAKAGKLDFLDLLVRARDLVKADAGVRRDLRARYSHILVDEFQDTDPLQAEILLLLASDERRIVPGKLFVVGDPKQSIYRFRRADVALYAEVKRQLIAEGGALLHLTTSFRSAPSIQRFVNDVFSRAMVGEAQAEYVPLEAYREDPAGRPTLVALPVPRPYGDYGKVVSWKIEESLPDAVGALVDWLIRESKWTVTERERPSARIPIEARHVCLLFKRFASGGDDATRPYVRALEARGVPHVLMGGRSYHAREEVLAIRNALGAIEWPDDELSVFATLRGPFFALGDDLLMAWRGEHGALNPLRPIPREALAEPLREVHDAIDVLRELHVGRNRRPIADTLGQLLEQTRAHAGVAIWPTGEQALANILRVLDLARRFEAQGATSFRGFVTRMLDEAERGGAPEAPVVEEGTDGVRLMTVHRAKGLEFPVVILVDPCAPPGPREPSRHSDPARALWAMPLAGCVPRDLLDHRAEVLARDRDEAIRLLYVATTRARELLVVPAVGDEPIADGWLSPLNAAIYPDPRDERSPRTAPGCPAFRGDDTVLERPPKVARGAESAVAPGLHTSGVGGHSIVWWDPVALALGKEHESGLRQQKLLEADEAGKATEEGVRQHAAWKGARAEMLARGGAASIRVRTATEIAAGGADPAPREVVHQEIEGRRADRPHHKRFGTLVHAVLAESPLDAGEAVVARVAAVQARLVGAPEDEARAAAEAARAALDHPILRRAAAAAQRGECRREVALTLTRDAGESETELVEGVVDLAFREDGAWIVVDYKTDAQIAEVERKKYEAQVTAYARAIERATGESARAVILRV